MNPYKHENHIAVDILGPKAQTLIRVRTRSDILAEAPFSARPPRRKEALLKRVFLGFLVGLWGYTVGVPFMAKGSSLRGFGFALSQLGHARRGLTESRGGLGLGISG